MMDNPARAATARVTDHIRLDHDWFRRQFAAVSDARDNVLALCVLWEELSARLEVHAAAEETLFYPRLLKDDADAADDTTDAIRDHNDIRDAIREAGQHEIGDVRWWAAVAAACNANDEHMHEEEEGPLREFDDVASSAEQAALAAAFSAFEQNHAGGRGISDEDKDPSRYVAEHLP